MSPNAGRWGGGGVAGFQPINTAVRSLNKLWRSNSIFNFCLFHCLFADGAVDIGQLTTVLAFSLALLFIFFKGSHTSPEHSEREGEEGNFFLL
jgi:hypothetical protein